MGNSLPASIRAFLAEHDSIAAMDVWNGYWIGGVSLLRSIERGDFPGSVESHRVMPIATDGGGNAFLMPGDSDGRVWKWSHETSEVKVLAEVPSNYFWTGWRTISVCSPPVKTTGHICPGNAHAGCSRGRSARKTPRRWLCRSRPGKIDRSGLAGVGEVGGGDFATLEASINEDRT